MADFCKQCSIATFGEDFGDLAGCSTAEQTFEYLCEGCGEYVPVDPEGNRSDGKWLKPHSKEWCERLKANIEREKHEQN